MTEGKCESEYEEEPSGGCECSMTHHCVDDEEHDGEHECGCGITWDEGTEPSGEDEE